MAGADHIVTDHLGQRARGDPAHLQQRCATGSRGRRRSARQEGVIEAHHTEASGTPYGTLAGPLPPLFGLPASPPRTSQACEGRRTDDHLNSMSRQSDPTMPTALRSVPSAPSNTLRTSRKAGDSSSSTAGMPRMGPARRGGLAVCGASPTRRRRRADYDQGLGTGHRLGPG